jgi:hypothetical protein
VRRVEYLDRLAEVAVKEAILKLRTAGARPCSSNVPAEAQQLLVQKGRARMSKADAEKRVRQAVERLRERKEIKAPTAPYNDWAVIGHETPPTAQT